MTAFLERGYAVVANARNMTQSSAFKPSEKLALVEGDIAKSATASTIAETAIAKFGSIDALVNNAGIFLAKPFTSYTVEDFRLLSSTNLARGLHLHHSSCDQAHDRTELRRKHCQHYNHPG